MKPVRAGKPVPFNRDRPDLPAQLEQIGDPNEVFEQTDFITIEKKRVQDLDRSSLRIDVFRVSDSLLERVHLAGGEFGSAVWKDSRLIGCDLANIRAHRIALVRVEFVDCRLTGFRATAVDWQDVLIENGEMSFCQLSGGRFRTCEFDRCDWRDADLQKADLSGSVFRSCNLARADLRAARLQNTDFRKSEVDGMVVGVSDLQGAIVDPAQAMVFARLMGLKIT